MGRRDAALVDERTWQQQVTDLLDLCGWSWNHTRRTIGRGNRWTTATSVTGWPDLTIWSNRHRSGLWAVELKTDAPGSKPTPEQWACLLALHDAGVPAFIWRPRDLDAVLRLLRTGDPASAPELTAEYLHRERNRD